MCRVFRLVLLGALLALPLSAAQKTEPSLAAFLRSLDPAPESKTALLCPPGEIDCCTPLVHCGPPVPTGISFVRQKDNGVCVYVCTTLQTCVDAHGCEPPYTVPSSFRVRSEPGEYPPGGCPAPDISFCSTMTVDP